MINKVWYKSKTIWGFGVAAIIALAQTIGITWSDALVANFIQILGLFFGGYGLRDAAAL